MEATVENVGKKNIPIKVWACIGGIVLAFEAYVLTKWITGPYFTPVEVGPSEVPQWMMMTLRTIEVVTLSLWLWCIWHFIVRPWRKEHRITVEGLLCVALGLVGYFLDNLCNYGGAVFTYNTAFLNLGSWIYEVPGCVLPGKPGASLSAPLWGLSIYASVIFLAPVVGCAAMRKLKKYRPQITPLGLLGSIFCVMTLFDIVFEGYMLMPLGTHTYAGAPDWMSINVDRYYKYDFLEGISYGCVWMCLSALLYFKDDKGNTIVERGIDELKYSTRRKNFLRFLAVCGFVAVVMIVCVLIPYYWKAGHMSHYPEEVQQRSYLLSGLCGEGTNQACFGPAVPLPRGNVSARVTPHGELFIPDGTELPKFVPLDRGPLGPKGDR